MTRFLDAALRLGFGVLLACAGLSAASASAAAAPDAPRAPEVIDAAGIIRSNPSAPAALALVRAGFVRFAARRSVPPPAAFPGAPSAASSLSASAVPAAPAAVRLSGAAPGALSRGPPAVSA